MGHRKPKQLTSRSEIFQADLYRMAEGPRRYERRVNDIRILQALHAKTINSQEGLPDFPSDVEPEDIELGNWICDSNTNPAVYCAYNARVDPVCDSCLYCGNPEERK